MKSEKRIDIEKNYNKEPMDDSQMEFFGFDYSVIYKLFKDTNLKVHPAFTPKISTYGKAIIFGDNFDDVIARYSSNGTLIVFNNNKLEKNINIKRFDSDFLMGTITYLLDFFKKIGVLKSYEKAFIDRFKRQIENPEVLNATFTISREVNFFMHEMFGNRSTNKIVNCSKVLKICETSANEQLTMDMFQSFKIIAQPFCDGIKLDFKLAAFKGHCLVRNGQYESIDSIFKKMVKEFLSVKKSMEFELDYIFTDSFFDEYKTINEMIEY